MIDSLFIISEIGTILIEKHWKGTKGRFCADQFIQTFRESTKPIVPVIRLNPEFIAIHIKRNDLYYLSILTQEVSPLMIIEFMNNLNQLMLDYFGNASELIIKENFVTVYQLLEEMIDYGYPRVTEFGSLKDIVPVPNIISKVMQNIVGVSSLNSSKDNVSLSSIAWRPLGIKHSHNEIFFDVIEEISANIEPNGTVSDFVIDGAIQCNCKLSGMPDILINLKNSTVLDDYSFHPCIRMKKFEAEKVLSFIPPDGPSKLVSYKLDIQDQRNFPVALNFDKSEEMLQISLFSFQAQLVQHVFMKIDIPSTVSDISVNNNGGHFNFDPLMKSIEWSIGGLKSSQKKVSLSLKFSKTNVIPTFSGSLSFELQGSALSGLKVDSLQLLNESYSPYKGVKYLSKSSNVALRM